MRTFVESLKRIYTKQYITTVYLNDLVTASKITQEEYDYIIA